jgi:hypothetical protein
MDQEVGSSILTEAPSAPAGGGNPAPQNAAEQALRDVETGPPEYIPAKFWDSDKRVPRIEDLGKGYQNLEKLLGREKVPVPTNDDDEEGWQRWYAASGRPEAPDKYEFKRPDQLPQGLGYDQDLEGHFRTMAHVNGLNKRQANALYDAYVKTQVERHAAYETGQKQARTQAEQALRRMHGQQYEAKLTAGKMLMTQYATPDLRKRLDETGMGNDPALIDMFIKLGEQMGGERQLQGKAPEQAGNPEDAKKAISEFRNRYEKELMSKEHPDHDLRVREYNQLFQRAYGNDPVR